MGGSVTAGLGAGVRAATAGALALGSTVAGRGAGARAGVGAAGARGVLAELPLTRNSATTSVSLSACSRRLSAAAEDSSTKAEFCCVI